MRQIQMRKMKRNSRTCLIVVILTISTLANLMTLPSAYAACSGCVVATIPIGNPSGIGVNPATNRIYVTSVSSTVFVIDGEQNIVVAAIRVGFNPVNVGVNPKTNQIYVANLGVFDQFGSVSASSVSVIDAATNTVVATIPTAPGLGPYAVGVNSKTNKIYVANARPPDFRTVSTVSVIDGATNTVVATIPVGFGPPGPTGVAVNPETNLIYVANSFSSTVSVIDGATDTVVATIPRGLSAVDVNPTNNRIYMNTFPNTVSVIDGATNIAVAAVPVGINPVGIGVNPVTNRIYVANNNIVATIVPGTVSVIDGATNAVLATVTVGTNPEGVGVNPVTNLIYVANLFSDTVSVIAGLGAPVAPLRVSGFFTDSSLNRLPFDSRGNPKVDVVLALGQVRSTNPGQVLAWVNVTNTSGSSVQSLKSNETLPVDWVVDPTWVPGAGSIHVFFANTASLATNLEITQQSTITVSTGNPEVVHFAVSNFTSTAIGHPLMPGQSILLSVKLTYGLIGTSQPAKSYPRNYTDTAGVAAWSLPSFTGAPSSGSGSACFTAYAKVLGDLDGDFKVDIVDAFLLLNGYNTRPGDARWNPAADLNNDGVVDFQDAVILSTYYGTSS